jgi:anti-sigma regulatory factor (Ser/Thr protein kinase)
MVAQPASVPAVRRFVDDALTDWGRTELIDDVGLSVTELATNATLHTDSSFFDVELRAAQDAVRVAVVDGGQVPASHIVARADFDVADVDELAAESMTGRGLFIVSALASTWGIEDLPTGTRVWADFASGPQGYEPSEPEVTGSRTPTPAAQDDVTVIELPGCPPELLLAHDDNLADYARELNLFGATRDDPEAVRAAQQIIEVVRLSALSWDAARLVAKQALHDRQDTVDIAIASSDVQDLPRKVQVLRRAVGAAEAMALRGELMTMPAPEPVQRWRDWVEAEMVGQATGERTPVRFADWSPTAG